jgi:hypothetical protein
MGVGASNLSQSRLDVYQESITKISQNLKSKASNSARQDVNINQKINFEVGSTNACDLPAQNQRACDVSCETLGQPPVYGCTFVGATASGSTITNTINCDAEYGTKADAFKYDDGICNGTNRDISEQEREDICYTRATRLICPIDPTERSETGESETGESETGDMCNDRCNVTSYMKINTNNGVTSYDYRNGRSPITSQPSGTEGIDWVKIDGGSLFKCDITKQGGSNYLNGYSLSDCKTDCAINNKCDIIGSPIVQGSVKCFGSGGGVCLSNTANVSMSSDQLADSNIKSDMTANITNDFQSEVMKTITQANEGLNFSQFNTSDEMTEITQIIKNSVSNNINNATENEIKQTSALNQEIDVVITGELVGMAGCPDSEPIDYSDCDDLEGDAKMNCQENTMNDYFSINPGNKECVSSGGSCGCDISNDTVQNIHNKQVAKSVIDSIFDSTVLNTLASSYTLTVDQLNEGPGLPLWLMVVLILGLVFAGVYTIRSGTTMLGKMGGVGIIIIFIAAIVAYYIFKGDNDDEEDKMKAACRTPGMIEGTGCSTVSDEGTCRQYGGCDYTEEDGCTNKEPGVCESEYTSSSSDCVTTAEGGCETGIDDDISGGLGGLFGDD